MRLCIKEIGKADRGEVWQDFGDFQENVFPTMSFISWKVVGFEGSCIFVFGVEITDVIFPGDPAAFIERRDDDQIERQVL